MAGSASIIENTRSITSLNSLGESKEAAIGYEPEVVPPAPEEVAPPAEVVPPARGGEERRLAGLRADVERDGVAAEEDDDEDGREVLDDDRDGADDDRDGVDEEDEDRGVDEDRDEPDDGREGVEEDDPDVLADRDGVERDDEDGVDEDEDRDGLDDREDRDGVDDRAADERDEPDDEDREGLDDGAAVERDEPDDDRDADEPDVDRDDAAREEAGLRAVEEDAPAAILRVPEAVEPRAAGFFAVDVLVAVPRAAEAPPSGPTSRAETRFARPSMSLRSPLSSSTTRSSSTSRMRFAAAVTSFARPRVDLAPSAEAVKVRSTAARTASTASAAPAVAFLPLFFESFLAMAARS